MQISIKYVLKRFSSIS